MTTMDEILQRQFPTVLMPRYGTLEPLAQTGDRFVLGADALKLEISRPWVHAVVDLTPARFARSLPYGKAPPDSITLRCGVIPRALMDAFAERARQACPYEVGAWIVWDENTRVFSLVELRALSHSPVHLYYEAPELPDGVWLVVDAHSHGEGRAGFSPTDDADDAGAVKFAMVYGRAHADGEWAVRAELLGLRLENPSIGVAQEAKPRMGAW